ncbi:MAG TPA: S41 family peptidase [Chloroflexota bacterium]|nr:S41 family peptidase [Chloroflexota bacterium]
MHDAGITIDAPRRAAVIDALLSKLRAHYVFPEVAERMEEAVRGGVRNGDYDGITTGSALRERLTAHLQEVSHDRHLRVFFSAEPRPPRERGEPSAEERAEFRQHAALRNFGFERVERLAGNVGYLDLREFFPPEVGGPTAVAAMNLLAAASALIIDLRKNGGGDPAMVTLLSSYLFAESKHLTSIYWREGDRTVQFWTLPYVPGPRLATTPVYVLTSSDTFSGAEDFTYNLQQLKRATIVGEVTGGGAHPSGGFAIDEHFGVGIPTGRSISPVSGTNWEGAGVTPDIAVAREEALKVAHSAALKGIVERCANQQSRLIRGLCEEAQQALAALEA